MLCIGIILLLLLINRSDSGLGPPSHRASDLIYLVFPRNNCDRPISPRFTKPLNQFL